MNNSLKILAVSLGALLACTAQAASVMAGSTAEAAPAAATAAAPVEVDRIVAVVNTDVITEYELQQRVHTVAINLRRQNIALPAMEDLRRQVLERLISERTIMQRARQTGIRVYARSACRWRACPAGLPYPKVCAGRAACPRYASVRA